MFRTLMLAGTALAVMTGAASADYYVVQEKSSKKCKVVETRPTETTWVQVGPLAFKTRDEADRQVKVDLQGASLTGRMRPCRRVWPDPRRSACLERGSGAQRGSRALQTRRARRGLPWRCAPTQVCHTIVDLHSDTWIAG